MLSIQLLNALFIILMVAEETTTQCDYTSCQNSGRQFCTCPNDYEEYSVPKMDTCPSMGCKLDGNQCYCNGTVCSYRSNDCNPTECDAQSSQRGCYCYFGQKILTTYYQSLNRSCYNADLFIEIGDNNGSYVCGSYSCQCDQFGECVCNPPKNSNPRMPTSKHCDSAECFARSFEFCQCDYSDCTYSPCNNFVQFKPLPESGICAGLINSSYYTCRNVGQKCRCQSSDGNYEGGKSETNCACVDVNPLYPASCEYCSSYASCICAYKEFRIQIPNAPKDCSALANPNPKSNSFSACPYRFGEDCTCEYNPNTGLNQCFCRNPNTSPQIPPFKRRPQLYTKCANDWDCLAHIELYCYCTNYVNESKVFKIPSSVIGNLTEIGYDAYGAEKFCYTYGKPPNYSCHRFGYSAQCVMGFCQRRPINLYFNDGY